MDWLSLEKGKALRFSTCEVVVMDYAYVPSPSEGLSEKYIVLLSREDPITPYIVTTVTPQSWKYREWGQGHYHSNPDTARGKYWGMVMSEGLHG